MLARMSERTSCGEPRSDSRTLGDDRGGMMAVTTTEGAVRAREQSWSDDPLDRTWRGRTCGGGLGVVLGVASDRDVGEKLSGEEKMEAVLDLHGLHSNEATEVLEQFLLGVSVCLIDFARRC